MKLGINERLKGKRLYKECWKPVVLLDTGESYEGLYEVSNMGRVRSLDRWINNSYGSKQFIKGKILKTRLNRGYETIDLHKDGNKKTISVHRLVAFAFVDGYFEGAIVDHIIPIANGGKNIYVNLHWVTHSENNNNPITLKNMSDSKKGQNVGENNPMYGKTHTEESRKKMSDSQKGRTPWNKGKKCPQMSGENNGFYGKHHTEENKEYLREKGIERGTKIRCIETGRIFRSFREAERVMKIDKKGIRRCCSGLQDNTKGYHFEYVTEEEVV